MVGVAIRRRGGTSITTSEETAAACCRRARTDSIRILLFVLFSLVHICVAHGLAREPKSLINEINRPFRGEKKKKNYKFVSAPDSHLYHPRNVPSQRKKCDSKVPSVTLTDFGSDSVDAAVALALRSPNSIQVPAHSSQPTIAKVNANKTFYIHRYAFASFNQKLVRVIKHSFPLLFLSQIANALTPISVSLEPRHSISLGVRHQASAPNACAITFSE